MNGFYKSEISNADPFDYMHNNLWAMLVLVVYGFVSTI